MKHEDIEPLTDSVRDLVRHVVAMAPAPDGARARVLVRVEAIVGWPSGRGGGRDSSGTQCAAEVVSQGLRPHFLIVDDDDAFGRRLEIILRRWGDCTIARNVEDACHAVRVRVYSAAFIDVRLEPGSGFDVLADLRAMRGTPVILLTGFFEGRDSVRACELGAQYVEKPISLAAVQAFVEAALQNPFNFALKRVSLDERVTAQAGAWRERYGLTDAEHDLLLRASLGEDHASIARARECSKRTVEKHCENILKKTGDASLQEAVARLLREVIGS